MRISMTETNLFPSSFAKPFIGLIFIAVIWSFFSLFNMHTYKKSLMLQLSFCILS